MSVEVVFGALLLALLGIGAGLAAIGRRYGKAILLWSGVMILAVVLGYVALMGFLILLCDLGKGCI